MPTPAERYAAARARQNSRVDRFAAQLGFELDAYQRRACEAVEAGRGVLVAAPTGAGKTVVGEFAVQLSLAEGRRAFYTTPIKALSNQKYRDLVTRHGPEQVGLLTGDTSVNGEASIVVMTTEVLRNMIYARSSSLHQLGYVVMDEVHYLADRARGAVWEEVIIHLPPSVQVISLSATVSNAEEFGQWLDQVRGDTAIVVSEERPVPLWQHVLVGRSLLDLFAATGSGERLNQDVLDAARDLQQHRRDRPRSRRDSGRRRQQPGRPRGGQGGRGDRRRGTGGSRPGGAASRVEAIDVLDREGLLPAITFVFSRAGCAGAVEQLLTAGVRLIPEDQGRRVRREVEARLGGLDEADLDVLGYWDFVDGLSRGFAAHHAGMLPQFREVVEELFSQARIRAVFATETLALGINMPARSVVIERLVKFNGQEHAEITPAEYTQLTGRAGRRGIDIDGHAVVVWSPGLDVPSVAGLASTRTYELRSSFAPTYNMAVNLVAGVGRRVAVDILQSSFAQFQADRDVVGLAATIRRHEQALAGYAEAMHCDRGDFAAYASLRHEVSRLEKDGRRSRAAAQRAQVAVSLEALRIGDVIAIPAGRRRGYAVVVAPARSRHGEPPAPTVVTAERQLHRLTAADVPTPVEALTRIRVPRQTDVRSPATRRDLASSIQAALPPGPPPRAVGSDPGPQAERIDQLRRQLKAHPCHGCPEREQHARWSERWWRLTRETTALQRRVDRRTNTVARTFERTCAVLVTMGYLEAGGEQVTRDGQMLRRIYSERDLVAAQCLREGVWTRLDAPELAAAVSLLVHEPRAERPDVAPRMPTQEVAQASTRMLGIWDDVVAAEREHGLDPTTEPDPGVAWMVHRWAAGARLETVLRGQDLAAGDFVRRCKQVVDLMDQLADASDDAALRGRLRAAARAVLRGVVAADHLD